MIRACLLVALFLFSTLAQAADADLILHNGKVASVDKDFTIHQAIAIAGERILKVGGNAEVLKLKGAKTEVIDLGGKLVIPGLIDSHVHSTAAAMTEYDHPIPDMESIQDVLNHIKARAKVLPEGTWINLRQIFITRLKEQRYPTKDELDAAAPKHPVLFATGPDASVNSLALELSGIDKDFKVSDGGTGYVEKDPATGEPTGIIRSCTRYIKSEGSGRQASEIDRLDRLRQLHKDYNSVGITGVVDRDASGTAINQYKKLLDNGLLTVRVACSHSVGNTGAIEKIQESIRQVAEHPLRTDGTPMLKIIGIKNYLDGGMLTGSAYMLQPWGVSKIYSITDPEYRGILYISKDRLLPIVQTTVDAGLQYTAHSVGDGAITTLLDVYEEVNRKTPIQKTRPSITHSNFMTKDAVERCAKLGVLVDIQPAWLYLDGGTLVKQFGNDRLRYFQPLKSLFEAGAIAGGGSDHMQKIGSLRAVNPYNPFLGMQTTITRRARWHDAPLHPEEALTREQALRFYTINNAKIMFLDDQVGSLEEGKRADLAVLDTDILSCPEEKIRDAVSVRTYVNGKLVYEKK